MNLKASLIVFVLVAIVASRRGGHRGRRLCRIFGDESIGNEQTVADFCNELKTNRTTFVEEQQKSLKTKIGEVCQTGNFTTATRKGKICEKILAQETQQDSGTGSGR
jgi:hypothetical protein